MLQILAFFLVVLAGALGFSWLVDHPGSVTFVWQGSEVVVSMTVFLISLAALIFAVGVVVWLVRAFFKTPGAIGHWWQARKRDRGYEALSSGIIAAGAGDAILARRMTKRSDKLLNSRKEPLIRFLDAQTAMIEGDHARARSAFEQMERDPGTRLLALRGLFLEAERVGDESAARHYAERAVRIAPHVPWAGGAVLESKSLAGDWDGALDILEAQKNTRLIASEDSRRLRAVLLTAKAMKVGEADPSKAKSAGIEAQKLAPDLTPAALVAAQACFRLGDTRRGTKILEQAFQNRPHPDIAEAYVHARSGDSVEDRLKRAAKIQALRPGNVDAETCLARAALDAGDHELARKSAMAAVDAEPRESGYLLLADIEEADTGEVGRVRQWLGKAIRAPRDPAWTADGVVSKNWAPISPVTGRLDAFRWKVPVERIGGEDTPLIEADDEPGDCAKPIRVIEAGGVNGAETGKKDQAPSGENTATSVSQDLKGPEAVGSEAGRAPEAKSAATGAAGSNGASGSGANGRAASENGGPRKEQKGVPAGSAATTIAGRGFGPTSDDRKEARFG